jgi:ABC-2 type transport system permease protein
MSEYLVVWKYQAKLFLRNKVLIFGVFVLLLSALFAAGYGNHFVQQQNSVIYTADTTHQNFLERVKDTYKNKTTPYTALARELAVYRPTPMSSLAIGQKDNYPFYHHTGVAMNVYSVTSTDIQNPLKLLAGNFDLSYVFIYLFPFFIIVFGYNVLSEEKENSTYTLLQIQGNGGKVVLNKLVFRMVVILVLSLVANVVAFAMNGISVKENGMEMLSWSLVTMMYIVFWFALVYFVVSRGWSGGISVLVLSGLWVLLLLLLPSVINKKVSRPQVAQQVESLFSQRGDVQRAAKMNLTTLVNSFNNLKLPYKLPSSADTGKVAREIKQIMITEVQARLDHNIGKKPIRQQSEEYRQTLSWNWLNPVFAVQNTYNQIAGTEINNYHDYLDAVESHQTKKRHFLHCQVLSGIPVTMETIEDMPKLEYKPAGVHYGKAIELMLPVLSLSGLFIVLGLLKRKSW